MGRKYLPEWQNRGTIALYLENLNIRIDFQYKDFTTWDSSSSAMYLFLIMNC